MSCVCFKRLVHYCRVHLTKKSADKPYMDEFDKIMPLSQWDKAPLKEGCSEWYYNRNPHNLELHAAVQKPKEFHSQRKSVGRIDYYHN